MLERVANFNDRCKGFDRIRAVIFKARTLAERDLERLPEIIAAIDAALADRQRHSAVIHADRAASSRPSHAEFALTES